MLELTDDHRAYLNEMRALSTDRDGNEVFVGLSVEESKRYLSYSLLDENGSRKRKTRDERSEYLALHDKHEAARFQVLGAEHVLRTMTPTKH